MVLSPYDVSDVNASIHKKQLITLENLIDSHLCMYYSDIKCKMPGLTVDKINILIENALIDKYERAG